MKTRVRELKDGTQEIIRLLSPDEMEAWYKDDPLSYEKSIVWISDITKIPFVRVKMVRSAKSRRGPIYLGDGRTCDWLFEAHSQRSARSGVEWVHAACLLSLARRCRSLNASRVALRSGPAHRVSGRSGAVRRARLRRFLHVSASLLGPPGRGSVRELPHVATEEISNLDTVLGLGRRAVAGRAGTK